MLTVHEILEQSNGRLATRIEENSVTGVSIDSRNIEPGNCFVAMSGSRANGIQFLKEASDRGASAYLVEESAYNEIVNGPQEECSRLISQLPNVIVFQSVRSAIGFLAGYYRNKYQGIVLGITGSCGKTTTKEYARILLENQHYSVTSNPGNYNNEIGVPLTLLNMALESDVLVSEMGASKPGDIAYLSQLLKPSVGIITNVFPCHLESFKTVDAIYQTKLELAHYLDSCNGTLIVNGDDERLLREVRNLNISIITFGKKKQCDVSLTSFKENDGEIEFEINNRYSFRLPSVAYFNLHNALAALAVAAYCNIDFANLKPAVHAFRSVGSRFNVSTGDIMIIDDSYNANPASFKEVLEVYKKVEVYGRKILICGDMLELGEQTKYYHRQLAQHIVNAGIMTVLGVGSGIRETIRALEEICFLEGGKVSVREYHYFDSHEKLLAHVTRYLKKGDAVLLKASRGIGLDSIGKALLEQYGAAKV